MASLPGERSMPVELWLLSYWPHKGKNFHLTSPFLESSGAEPLFSMGMWCVFGQWRSCLWGGQSILCYIFAVHDFYSFWICPFQQEHSDGLWSEFTLEYSQPCLTQLAVTMQTSRLWLFPLFEPLRNRRHRYSVLPGCHDCDHSPKLQSSHSLPNHSPRGLRRFGLHHSLIE